MTDQEILNRIDAEIARVHAIDGKSDIQETQLSQETQLALTQLALVAYTHGLKFAKALIEKRTEEVGR